MVDDITNIISGLNTILTTIYDLGQDSDSPEKPYISIFDGSNTSYKEGDTVRYSNVEYTVKLWVNSRAEINTYINTIDEKMKSLGYRRVGGNTLTFNNYLCQVINYRGLGVERT